MPQGFQKYFFQNGTKWGVESASQATQPIQPIQAEMAVLSSWQILHPIFQDFEKKYFWNPCSIPVHLAEVKVLGFETSLDLSLGHCVKLLLFLRLFKQWQHSESQQSYQTELYEEISCLLPPCKIMILGYSTFSNLSGHQPSTTENFVKSFITYQKKPAVRVLPTLQIYTARLQLCYS